MKATGDSFPMFICDQVSWVTNVVVSLFTQTDTDHKSLFLAPDADVYKTQKCSCDEAAVSR